MLATRTIARITAVAAIAATIAISGGPAMAGPPIQCDGTEQNTPDGKMNADGGPFAGARQYPDTAINIFPVVDDQVTFLLKWKNVSDSPQTIQVIDGTNFLVSVETARRVFVGGVNVTKFFRLTGELAFFGVQPGKRVTIEVVLKNRADETRFTGYRLQGRYAGSGPGSCDELVPLIND